MLAPVSAWTMCEEGGEAAESREENRKDWPWAAWQALRGLARTGKTGPRLESGISKAAQSLVQSGDGTAFSKARRVKAVGDEEGGEGAESRIWRTPRPQVFTF